jgi:tellurite resistance protein TerC
VPAIFGITTDPYIVFTSNVFAILGLRALYFLLAGVMEMFRYLHYGLAGVLGFVGVKMIAAWQFPHRDGTPFCPAWASLAAIAAILGISIAASLAIPGRGRTEL